LVDEATERVRTIEEREALLTARELDLMAREDSLAEKHRMVDENAADFKMAISRIYTVRDFPYLFPKLWLIKLGIQNYQCSKC